MEIIKHYIEIQKFKNSEELSEMQLLLLKQAYSETYKAYAPYSHYHVGVALLLSNQEIISANNQENAAYPSGLCAERVTAFYAKAKFPEAKILKMAITATSSLSSETISLPFPCGSCRQVLSEYENKDKQPIELIIKGGDDVVFVIPSIASILPLTFN